MAGGGAFTPKKLTVELGQTVTWWNTDYNRHTVTAYEERLPEGASYFDSAGASSEQQAFREYDLEDTLDEGDQFSHTFDTPGYHHYFCIPHESPMTMAGTIVVKDASGEVPPAPTVVQPETDHVVQMGTQSFYPDVLTIQAGESIGWVNGTMIAHSVTARTVPFGATYFASGGFNTEEAALDDWGPFGYQREGDVTYDEPYTETFDVPGVYEYYCILHDWAMRGTIRVKPNQ